MSALLPPLRCRRRCALWWLCDVIPTFLLSSRSDANLQHLSVLQLSDSPVLPTHRSGEWRLSLSEGVPAAPVLTEVWRLPRQH